MARAADGVMLFTLGQRRFALQRAAVSELVPLGLLTPVPFCPPVFIGAAHHRGQILPVVDLAVLYGETPIAVEQGKVCIRVEDPPYQLLLYVGRVEEIPGPEEPGASTALPGPLNFINVQALIRRLRDEVAKTVAELSFQQPEDAVRSLDGEHRHIRVKYP